MSISSTFISFFSFPFLRIHARRRRRGLSAYTFDGNRELGFASKQCDENENGTGVYSLSAIKAQEMPRAPV